MNVEDKGTRHTHYLILERESYAFYKKLVDMGKIDSPWEFLLEQELVIDKLEFRVYKSIINEYIIKSLDPLTIDLKAHFDSYLNPKLMGGTGKQEIIDYTKKLMKQMFPHYDFQGDIFKKKPLIDEKKKDNNSEGSSGEDKKGDATPEDHNSK